MARSMARRVFFGGPLAGACVVVTRVGSAARSMRRSVQARGGCAIGLPGFALHAPADLALARRALGAARGADVVVFTSPIAVQFAWSLLPALRFARRTQVCAIGAGSARALRRHGVTQPIAPDARNDSEGLLDLPQLRRVRGLHIALIGAPGGRDLLLRQLRRRGARVDQVGVYRRMPPRLNRRHLAALERAQAPLIALFSSADALANLHALLPPALFARLLSNECVCASARVAEVARSLRFENVHVAAGATPTTLLDAAGAALARHRL
jgi:uroporphyrinogen-III synthase